MARRFTTALAIALLLLCWHVPLRADEVLVVCREEFRPALQPWLAHRAAQGHRVKFVAAGETADQQRRAIRETAAGGNPTFLLLVGDVDRVPARLVDARVTVKWGSEPEIATDNWYADLDDDDVPELAVGRLSADTPDELAAMVRKIVAYETLASAGTWRRRINFVAGLGGFGGLADAAIEACAKRFICEGVPAAYHTTMTYASWRSPFCPDPRLFGHTALRRLNEGCLFWVYIGHGHAWGLDHVRVPGGEFSILELADLRRVRCSEGQPIALLLSCHAGAFDAPQDCLAEEMLRSEGGPVAAVCGSRVTMPYAMAALCAEAMRECFQQQRQTLGEMLLHAKRNTMLRPRTDEPSKVLDALAAALNPGSDLAEERREHLHLFNLLGDPLLRLPHPKSVELTVSESSAPGEVLRVSGVCDVDGDCTVELVVPRDRLPLRPAPRRQFDATPAVLAQYQETYEQANDGRLAATQTVSAGGLFSAQLAVPADARGACYVRVFVANHRECAQGAAPVRIEPVQR